MSESELSPASQAYILRKNLYTCVLDAQKKEHHFYQQVANKVEDAATRLSNEFSELIQGKLLEWDEGTAQKFSRSADIPLTQLRAWQSDVIRMNKANASLEAATIKFKQLKSITSGFSGALWGAKNGFESEYAMAKKNSDEAEGDVKLCAGACSRELKAAQNKGAALLELCVKNSWKLAECTTFGSRYKALLNEIGEDAAKAMEAYNVEQRCQIAEMRIVLEQLGKLYGEV